MMEFTENHQVYKLLNDNVEQIDSTQYTIYQLLELVKQDCTIIKFIKEPSEEIQLAAVNQNGFAIQYITDPSEEVQLEAVTNVGMSIQCIKNPTIKAKLT